MILRKLKYFFARAALSLRESLLLNSLTVLTIIITMLILSSFLLIFHNVSQVLGSKKASLEISVYLEDDIKKEQVEVLSKNIRKNEMVKSVSFFSRDDALKRFLSWNRKLEPLVKGLGENPFPASLEIVLKSGITEIEKVDSFAKELSGQKGVIKVNYSSQWAKKLSSFMSALKGIGLFLLFFLSVATLFMVSNTIRLNIYARRDEISIMRLVGATNGFIKIPFLIEGSLQGIIGSAGALLILFVIYKVSYSSFEDALSRLGSSSYSFISSGYIVFVFTLGTLVGLVGAAFAVRRFLRRET